MARVMIGLFDDRGSAEQAVIELKAAGFDPDRMGFVMRDQQEARKAADDVGGAHTGVGAATGGIVGAGIGAILAATGAFVIPGIGPFVSAGILATAIVGGAAGALVGALVGLGIPREEAEYYNRRVEEGSALVTLDPEGRESDARTILLHHGAEDTWRTTPLGFAARSSWHDGRHRTWAGVRATTKVRHRWWPYGSPLARGRPGPQTCSNGRVGSDEAQSGV